MIIKINQIQRMTIGLCETITFYTNNRLRDLLCAGKQQNETDK